jgi:hypothetical protein
MCEIIAPNKLNSCITTFSLQASRNVELSREFGFMDNSIYHESCVREFGFMDNSIYHESCVLDRNGNLKVELNYVLLRTTRHVGRRQLWARWL